MYSSYGTGQQFNLQRSRNNLGALALAYITSYRPHKNPKLTVVLVLWLFGLFAMLLSPAPVALSPEKIARYEAKIQQLDKQFKARGPADARLFEAEMDLQEAKVWFWRFRSEHRGRVHKKQALQKAARAEVEKYNKRERQIISDAKAELGLWSEAGVTESRKMFWQSFEAGKVFGRRQTFWDALFAIMGSRDRNIPMLLIELIFQAVVNFTAGMFVSTFVFLFQLPSFIASYQSGWASAIGFFLVACVAALSFITTWLAGLFTVSATAAYTVATLATPRRLQGQQGYPPGYIRHHMD